MKIDATHPKDRTRPRVLSDDPERVDAFGGHARVAESLADIIQFDEGGKAIALTGPYGSGKSTVVNLLERRLQESLTNGKGDTSTTLFVFDAWAHRGDPLRRSFIESLVEHLRSVGWADESEWQNELDLLSQRKEITHTKTEPKLTIWGGLVAISLLLLPLGFGLLRNVGHPTSPGWIAWIGGLLSALPFLVLVVSWLWWRPWRSKHRKDLSGLRDYLTKHRPPYQGRSIFALFVQQRHEEVRSDTVRTPDPTSLEFRKFFSRILSRTFAGTDRKLVIVVDNLDRLLSSEETIKAWASMRTFFEPGSNRQPDWEKNFWLLVPFDPEALRQVWPQEEDAPQVASPNTRIPRDGLLQGFIDKTFQVRFRVAPPVLSDWRVYLVKQLKDAFPAHAAQPSFEADSHRVYRLYQLIRVAGNKPPTPRQLKMFVNEVSGLFRQWQGDIPLEAMALYVLLQQDISASASELVQSDFPAPVIKRTLHDNNWQRHLAALHFNVKPEKAIQVLIGDRVSEALLSGDSAGLQEIEQVSGFYPTLEEQVSQIRAEQEPHAIASAAIAVGNLSPSPSPSYNEAWRQLIGAARDVDDWRPNTRAVGRGLANILDHAGAESRADLAEQFLTSLSKVDVNVSSEDSEEEGYAPAAWSDAVVELVAYLERMGDEQLLQEHFSVPGEADAYVAVMEHLSEDTDAGEIAQHYIPIAEREAVVAHLASQCASGVFRSAHARTIGLMQQVSSASSSLQWEWDRLANQLNQRLQINNQNVEKAEAAACADSLLRLARGSNSGQAKKVMTPLSRGPLLHHFHQAQDDPDKAAAHLLGIVLYNPAVAKSANQGQMNAGQVAVNKVLDDPGDYPNVVSVTADLVATLDITASLFQVADAATGTESFVRSILQRLAKQDNASRLFTPGLICSKRRYRHIVAALDDSDLNDIIETFLNEGRLLDWMGREELFAGYALDLHRRVVAQLSENELPEYNELLVSKAQELKKEKWEEALNEEEDRLHILVDIVERGINPQLATPYSDALREHARRIRSGESDISGLADKWHYLVSAMDEDVKVSFLRDLSDDLVDQDTGSIGSVLSLYGDELHQTGIWPAKADKAFRGLFSQIVERKDPRELRWLAALLNANSAIVGEADQEIVSTFRKRVDTHLDDADDDDIQPLLLALADATGVFSNAGDGNKDADDKTEGIEL